jgi:hypothetical protein
MRHFLLVLYASAENRDWVEGCMRLALAMAGPRYKGKTQLVCLTPLALSLFTCPLAFQ